MRFHITLIFLSKNTSKKKNSTIFFFFKLLSFYSRNTSRKENSTFFFFQVTFIFIQKTNLRRKFNIFSFSSHFQFWKTYHSKKCCVRLNVAQVPWSVYIDKFCLWCQNFKICCPPEAIKQNLQIKLVTLSYVYVDFDQIPLFKLSNMRIFISIFFFFFSLSIYWLSNMHIFIIFILNSIQQ